MPRHNVKKQKNISKVVIIPYLQFDSRHTNFIHYIGNNLDFFSTIFMSFMTGSPVRSYKNKYDIITSFALGLNVDLNCY